MKPKERCADRVAWLSGPAAGKIADAALPATAVIGDGGLRVASDDEVADHLGPVNRWARVHRHADIIHRDPYKWTRNTARI